MKVTLIPAILYQASIFEPMERIKRIGKTQEKGEEKIEDEENTTNKNRFPIKWRFIFVECFYFPIAFSLPLDCLQALKFIFIRCATTNKTTHSLTANAMNWTLKLWEVFCLLHDKFHLKNEFCRAFAILSFEIKERKKR